MTKKQDYAGCYVPGCDRGSHCDPEELPQNTMMGRFHYWLDPRPEAEPEQLDRVVQWLDTDSPDGIGHYKIRRDPAIWKAAKLICKAYRRWYRDEAIEQAAAVMRDREEVANRLG